MDKIEALVDSESETFSYETDDSYSLKVGQKTAEITAKSEMGVARALATLTQLITETEDPSAYTVEGGQFSDGTSVRWRHYYVDACSHFMGVADVERIVDVASL